LICIQAVLGIFAVLALHPVEFPGQDPAGPAYRNPAFSTGERVEDLLRRMTLEEKFWQLFMIPGDLSQGEERFRSGIFGLQISSRARSAGDAAQMLDYSPGGSARAMARNINRTQRFFREETRLGIPIIPFDEALHGLVREGATAFPQAIGLAATWDVDCLGRVAGAIADETRSRGIRQVLSPVVNLARDVRWGRVEETYGEDPFLAAAMARAFVSAFEDAGVVTTPKHFVANFGDGGRDSYPVHASERALRETSFPVFQACFQAGARSVMTAYNSLDGVPCTANGWLLETVLKEEWGFKGFVVSDAGAVGGLLDLHHTVTSREESAVDAFTNGLDVVFQTDYNHHVPLLKAFLDGSIPEETIDEAVRRVLRAKFELGLFDDPFVDPGRAAAVNGCREHRLLALEAAHKSIVLLKNDGGVLPLQWDLESIAVIGLDAKEARLGGYSGPGTDRICILEGIQEQAPEDATVRYAAGCGRSGPRLVTIPAACLSTGDSGVKVPGLRGEYFDGIRVEGTPQISRIDSEVRFKWTLFPPGPGLSSAWYSVRWTGKLKAACSGRFEIGIEGNDGFRLFLDGKKIVDQWTKQTCRTLAVPFVFEKDREYDLRLEFYENTGNGQVNLVWNCGTGDQGGQGIAEAVRLAGESGVAVVVAGIEEGEFRDRANIGLPGLQERMIHAVAATGTPTVVVLVGGSAVTMTSWIDEVSAVIMAWYPGEAGGAAVAHVLFGAFNPAGRLPITFPRSVAQLPLYYNHKPTGRGDDYLDMTGLPLFPFGFGLSYTTFEYDELEITAGEAAPEDGALVSFAVANTGFRAGEEVVQVYLHDCEASVTRPVRELVGFRRIALEPGESRRVSIRVPRWNFSLLDKELQRRVEPGRFKILVGASSRDIRLRGLLQVE